MGLLLSVLITCVGVLEVIACYTHFRLGVAYSDCKTNIRHVARYYALELRKHELHFESGPHDPGPSTSTDTLSDLINRRLPSPSKSLQVDNVTHEGSPNPAANLKVPRNSVCGLDSPTVQTLISPEIDITQAVEKIQHLDDLDKDIWKSRSPSPFPESDSGVETKSPDIPELSDIPESLPCSPGNQLVERNYWNKSPVMTPESVDDTGYSKTDLEVQDITEKITRQPSPYPDVLFGITADNVDEETKFDEAFLRSLDGVKTSRCDDKRRSFRKKRNSSSTSSRASEISRSLTSLDDIDNIERLDLKKIAPLAEEIEEQRPESFSEKCESIASPIPEDKIEAKVSSHEETKFEAKVNPNASQEVPGKTNLSFTEKVKDLEISVQLLVTVKGTSQGDKMEYTTTVNQDPQPQDEKVIVKEEITKSSEEKSEFGNVKTSVTYGTGTHEDQQSLKDLQISSQSLIHAERAVQDDVSSSEAEFLKLYETFTELPDRQKDEFLKIIGHPKSEVENEEIVPQEDIDEEVANITRNITPKTILKKVSEENNIPEIKEETIDDLNLPENMPKGTAEIIRSMSPFRPDEKVHITEITEITESTESVITLPAETKNEQGSDAQSIELSASDKTVSQVLSTKECDQDSIVNKRAKEKNEQTIGSPEKIENISEAKINDEKVVCTVTTKEPQVIRQLTTTQIRNGSHSKPQKIIEQEIISPNNNIENVHSNINKITTVLDAENVQPTVESKNNSTTEQTTINDNISTKEVLNQNVEISKVPYVIEETKLNDFAPLSSFITENITETTVQQQETVPRKNIQENIEQQIIQVEIVPNKIAYTEEIKTVTEQQESKPETFEQKEVQQQQITSNKEVQNQNVVEVITTTKQESIPEAQHVEKRIEQTTKQEIPVQNQNIVEEITSVTIKQESAPKAHVHGTIEQQILTLKQEIPEQNQNIVDEVTTAVTITQQESTPQIVAEKNIIQQIVTTKPEIQVQNQNIIEKVTTVITSKQEPVPETATEKNIVQQTVTTRQETPVQNQNIIEEVTTVISTKQESVPETTTEKNIVQQTVTTKQETPLQNQNIIEEVTTVITTKQESVPETTTEKNIVQQTVTTKQETPVQNQNIIEEVTTVISTKQDSVPETATEKNIVQQAVTTKQETQVQNQNIIEEVTTIITTKQESVPETTTEKNIVQQAVTTKQETPVQNQNIIEEVTTVITTKQESVPDTSAKKKVVQKTVTTKQEIPVQGENISEEITTVTTTVQQESIPKTVVEQLIEQQTTTSQPEIPLPNEKNIAALEETVISTSEKLTQEIFPQPQSKQILISDTVINKTPIEQKSEPSPIPTETKIEPTTVQIESSSESSSTPTTVIEKLRKASKTSFEEATPVQNQEMMRRKLSNSEVSPKQASQAFWEPMDQDGGPSPNK